MFILEVYPRLQDGGENLGTSTCVPICLGLEHALLEPIPEVGMQRFFQGMQRFIQEITMFW